MIPFRQLVENRIRREPEFAATLLEEALELLIGNDLVTAQLLLRDIVNGTVGFAAMSDATGIPEKSLMRMLSVKGNPQARNLFAIIDRLQEMNGVRLEVHAKPSSRAAR
jgi:DNA-binding phage protein